MRGSSDDALMGLGYLFPTEKCWSMAFFIGWSYDRLRMTTQDVHAPLDGRVFDIGPISFKSQYQGPWIGSDIFFKPSPRYSLLLGHEIHFAYWSGNRKIKGGDLGSEFGEVTGFSNTRRLSGNWGNVFRIENSFEIVSSFFLGVNLKYQNWLSTGSGHYKRTQTPLPMGVTTKLVNDVEWQSFSATASLNYVF